MISERDLRLAKAIVDPYIGQDIIATAVSVKCGAFGTYDPLATLADGLLS